MNERAGTWMNTWLRTGRCPPAPRACPVAGRVTRVCAVSHGGPHPAPLGNACNRPRLLRNPGVLPFHLVVFRNTLSMYVTCPVATKNMACLEKTRDPWHGGIISAISFKLSSLAGPRVLDFDNTQQNRACPQVAVSTHAGAMEIITLLGSAYTSENWYLNSDTKNIQFLNVGYFTTNTICFAFSFDI